MGYDLVSDTTARIQLPYAAFDLVASHPLVESSSRYFPLKRASNTRQYTLGRTFLQEAYLVTDYERKRYTIGQRLWNQSAQPTIVPIMAIESRHSLSSGTIAGIVVAIVAVVMLLIVVLWLCRGRPWRAAKRHGPATFMQSTIPEEEDCKLYEIGQVRPPELPTNDAGYSGPAELGA